MHRATTSIPRPPTPASLIPLPAAPRCEDLLPVCPLPSWDSERKGEERTEVGPGQTARQKHEENQSTLSFIQDPCSDKAEQSLNWDKGHTGPQGAPFMSPPFETQKWSLVSYRIKPPSGPFSSPVCHWPAALGSHPVRHHFPFAPQPPCSTGHRPPMSEHWEPLPSIPSVRCFSHPVTVSQSFHLGFRVPQVQDPSLAVPYPGTRYSV